MKFSIAVARYAKFEANKLRITPSSSQNKRAFRVVYRQYGNFALKRPYRRPNRQI
jgi:hypothetical protein